LCGKVRFTPKSVLYLSVFCSVKQFLYLTNPEKWELRC